MATRQPEPTSNAAARELFAAALDYARAGLPVFPLKPHGKRPVTLDGLEAATVDPERIEAWWRTTPTANVAIRTGAASGLVVLDVDVQHGGAGTLKALEAEHGPLPETARTLTGGGGNHYVFRHPGGEFRNSAGALGPGLDVRGDGGYIVAPPSVHESGRAYVWLRELERGVADLPVLILADAERRRKSPAAKVDEVIPEGMRRAAMLTVAGKLKRAGLSGDEIIPALRALNDKRCRPPLDERELESIAYPSTIQAAEQLGKPKYDGPTRELASVVDVFRGWLYLPDPAAVLVTCATVAANRVESFDPLWCLVVGAAGSGKTEALNATSKLDGIHVAATITEAALLSGTPRKDTTHGASGGLLRELGDAGVLVLKDFGSVLSMNRDARAGVLAALRELYDGAWTRLVGVDGGRRLHWEGRLGLLAGATTVIDQHHAVMAQLGERFLIHRLVVDDAARQGRSSLAHHGRERGMRRELAEAVAGLFAGLDFSAPPELAPADVERLVALSQLVARARSPVIRDAYRREIELVPDSEAPGRIIGALARLLTGLRLIGVDDVEAWRVTVKTALDSMPAARWRALELLLGCAEATTTEAATELGLPTQTARRVLEDLTAHGLSTRESQGEGKADLWRIEPWVGERYREVTFPEMSETPIYRYSNYTYDDISEKVGPT